MNKYLYFLEKQAEAEQKANEFFNNPLMWIFYKNAAKGFYIKAMSLTLEEACE